MSFIQGIIVQGRCIVILYLIGMKSVAVGRNYIYHHKRILDVDGYER